jgi:hypothetical protein
MKLIDSAGPLAGGSNYKLPDCRPVIHLLLLFIPRRQIDSSTAPIPSSPPGGTRSALKRRAIDFFPPFISRFFPFSQRPCPLIGHSIGSQLRRQHTLDWQAKWSESEKCVSTSLCNEGVPRPFFFKFPKIFISCRRLLFFEACIPPDRFRLDALSE